MCTDIHFQVGVVFVARSATASTNGGESASSCGGFPAEVESSYKVRKII